jgi:uncharacterized protein YigE (DUF2233 family)
MTTATLRLRVPCCDSIRSCNVTAIYIRDINTMEVVRRISAVRCYRLGYNPHVVVEFDPQRHTIYYFYVSNRGNPWISFHHIPPQLSEEEARRIVLAHHGFI